MHLKHLSLLAKSPVNTGLFALLFRGFNLPIFCAGLAVFAISSTFLHSDLCFIDNLIASFGFLVRRPIFMFSAL